MTTLYNEWDPYAAEWLKNLVRDGLIAPGVVNDRSIADITPDDLVGVSQFHAFAGIGGWSAACRLAGIPDDFPIWTGSCPCQPLSDAGARRGTSDPRHLWPAWFSLIEKCRPPVIAGEQVASQLGLGWLDLVFADLERCGYAVGAADLGAAGVGSPHIRQRLYFFAVADDDERGRALVRQTRLHDHWKPGDHPARRRASVFVADSAGSRWPEGGALGSGGGDGTPPNGRRDRSADHGQDVDVGDAEGIGCAARRVDRPHGRSPLEPDGPGTDGGLVHTNGARLEIGDGRDSREGRPHEPSGATIGTAGAMGNPDGGREDPVAGVLGGADADHEGSVLGGGLGDAGSDRARQHLGELPGDEGQHDVRPPDGDHSPIPPGATRGFWAGCDWIWCQDGVYRPAKPGTLPLAHGTSGRVAIRGTSGQAVEEEAIDPAPDPDAEHWYNRTGALSGCGNAIVRQVAAAFIQASFEAISQTE